MRPARTVGLAALEAAGVRAALSDAMDAVTG